MPIHRAGASASCSRPSTVSQINKGRQDRRMFKPKRVASSWQENISAQVKPRSENRWRVSRPQPPLATFLQFVMLLEQVKSVGFVREAPLRDTTALIPVHGATALIPVHDTTALAPVHGATALVPVHETTVRLPVHGMANNSSRWNWNIRDLLGVAGCRNINLPMPKSLNDLPPELLSMIGTHLPEQDIGRLIQVNRRLRDTFVQENQAGRFVMQAQQVTRLTEFRALLGNPEDGGAGILGLRISLQQRPLAALIGRLRILPGDERFAGFQLIHDAVSDARLPMARRAAALTGLAMETYELNVRDRWPAFKLLHNATTAATFPMEHRAALLARLARLILNLPAPDRPDAHRRVLSAVVKLDKQNRGAVLKALAISIVRLPKQARGPALYAVQNAIAELDMLDSGAPFDMLALVLSFLLMSDSSEPLRQFVAQIDWLPDHRRAQMLRAPQRF